MDTCVCVKYSSHKLTWTHTCSDKHTKTHTHTADTHTHVQINTHAFTHTHRHTHTVVHTQRDTHTHMHLQSYTYTHTHSLTINSALSIFHSREPSLGWVIDHHNVSSQTPIWLRPGCLCQCSRMKVNQTNHWMRLHRRVAIKNNISHHMAQLNSSLITGRSRAAI